MRTSKPRTRPLVLLCVFGVPPSSIAAPIITTPSFVIGRRGVQPDLAGLAIDLLALAEHDIVLQIDDAVLAERRDAVAGLRVERDEPVAGRDVEDALVLAVGPVRDAAAGQLARRRRRARAFALANAPTSTRRSRRRARRPSAACPPVV